MKNSNQKGITLVALVVTIVVLLILAGITITYVLSDQGIFGKAQTAATETAKGYISEQVNLIVIGLQADLYAPGVTLTPETANTAAASALKTAGITGTLTFKTTDTTAGITTDDTTALAELTYNKVTCTVKIDTKSETPITITAK